MIKTIRSYNSFNERCFNESSVMACNYKCCTKSIFIIRVREVVSRGNVLTKRRCASFFQFTKFWNQKTIFFRPFVHSYQNYNHLKLNVCDLITIDLPRRSKQKSENRKKNV